MHRILTRPATWVLASLASLAVLIPAVAAAKPHVVTVRVEGASATLLPQTQVSTTTAKTLGGHPCGGSTAAAALDNATGGQWSGKWFSSFDDFQVFTILGETPAGANDYWTLWIDGRSSSTGACATTLHAGDHELWFDCLGDSQGNCSNDPLAVRAPSAVRRGHRVTVRVTQLDAGGHGTPVSGAVLSGGGVVKVTGDGGTATFRAPKSGLLELQATKSGATPSDLTGLCVYPRRRAQCTAIRRQGS